MSVSLGTRLKIRSMIFLASEPIPYFWPMRTFIHHNPLHGLEDLPFPEAVEKGTRLLHGKGYLPRHVYQGYLAEGKIDEDALAKEIDAFLAQHDALDALNLRHWLTNLLTQSERPVCPKNNGVDVADVAALLSGGSLPAGGGLSAEGAAQQLKEKLLGDCPIYEAVDAIFGSSIAEELDELVIKRCLNFFDEGQSSWDMPGREQGLFKAWSNVASRNIPLFPRDRHIRHILAETTEAEDVIAYVLEKLGIPEQHWMDYFTRELTHLHGWVGFIRWRSNAKRYYWTMKNPADLIDFLAVRLTLGLGLLLAHKRSSKAHHRDGLKQLIKQQTRETYLRHELNSGQVLPACAHHIEQALAHNKQTEIDAAFDSYVALKREHNARKQVDRLNSLARLAGEENALKKLSGEDLARLLKILSDFERAEGMVWLRSMESKAITRVLDDINLKPEDAEQKRPFAQALFCIDTRSEPIRRHLESVGDYQTFGIAGFFGVPVSFMSLGKGSEVHLCPVILTPHNLVLELSSSDVQNELAALTTLDKAVHELKESILTPFVTVEAIGLLFGFDMIGKTVAPHGYHNWRKHLHDEAPLTHLLLDKLSRKQADSILRAVQRGVIVKALEQEFGLVHGDVTDDMVRELRESALGNQTSLVHCAARLDLEEEELLGFIQRLRSDYRINQAFTHLQMEQLGRIGFTLDEQANYVSQALLSIGLTKNFSRFVLLVGHGSTSENNPYESALECGACGGNHGFTSARVLSQMANKPEVRRRLIRQGINIPDDTWFLPAAHNTVTDDIQLLCLERIPPTHLLYIDRLRNGLTAASQLCAQERVPTLEIQSGKKFNPVTAFQRAQRNAVDWSQVRPEWGLSRNAYFIIGRREISDEALLESRAFLHSYDYRIDPKQRLLENILTGPLVVGQWINMEHYFSAVDNETFGSGSKVTHNVAGQFGVMTGNLSDLRTGLPAQTVLKDGLPYHEPIRLITLIEAPLQHAKRALDAVVTVKNLVKNGWIRLLVIDPLSRRIYLFDHDNWQEVRQLNDSEQTNLEEILQHEK